jgi:hypothetical protein
MLKKDDMEPCKKCRKEDEKGLWLRFLTSLLAAIWRRLTPFITRERPKYDIQTLKPPRFYCPLCDKYLKPEVVKLPQPPLTDPQLEDEYVPDYNSGPHFEGADGLVTTYRVNCHGKTKDVGITIVSMLIAECHQVVLFDEDDRRAYYSRSEQVRI